MSDAQTSIPSRPWRERAPGFAIGVVLAGAVLLRLRQYLADRPLWLDEVMLALNLGTRSFTGLTGRLDHDQGAPLLFLWFEKLAVLAGGVDELTLRILPLLAGCLSVLLVALVARRVLRPWPAVLATLWFAVQPLPVSYSNELKPYMLGAALRLALALLVLRLFERPHGGRWWPLTLVSVLDPLASVSAPLALGGISAALVASPDIRRTPALRRRWFWYSAAWLAVAGAVYLWLLAPLRADHYFREYMSGAFLKLGSAAAAQHSLHVVAEFLAGFVLVGDWWLRVWWLPMVVMCAACTLALVHWARRGELALAVLFASPIAAALAAATIGLYPFLPRLVLWTAPSLTIMAVAGTDALAQRLPAWPRRAVGLGFLLVLAIPAQEAWRRTAHVARREDTPPLIADWLAQSAPGQAIYVSARAVPSWAFYTTDWQAPDRGRLDWIAAINQSSGVAFRNAPPRGHAVRREGFDLVRRELGHVVLYGIPSGIQITPEGLRSSMPDTAWADNEATRIEEAVGDSVWLLFAHNVPVELDSLRASLGRHGARQLHTRHTNGADLDLWLMDEATDRPR